MAHVILPDCMAHVIPPDCMAHVILPDCMAHVILSGTKWSRRTDVRFAKNRTPVDLTHIHHFD